LRQHRLAWAGLARSIDTAQAFLVYTTPRTLLIVPKRAFADADVLTLRNMLAERVTAQPAPTGGLLGGSVTRVLVLWAALIVAFLAVWHFLDEGAPPARRRADPSGMPAASQKDLGEAKDVDSSP